MPVMAGASRWLEACTGMLPAAHKVPMAARIGSRRVRGVECAFMVFLAPGLENSAPESIRSGSTRALRPPISRVLRTVFAFGCGPTEQCGFFDGWLSLSYVVANGRCKKWRCDSTSRRIQLETP